ncbi:MAG: cellulase family glycosylhydrolase [Candidatus Eremiobacterota bacterium]
MRGLLLALLLLAQAVAEPAWVERRGTELVAEGRPLIVKGMCLGNWFVPEGYMFGFEKAVSPRQIQQVTAELLGPAGSRRWWEAWYDRYVTPRDLELLSKLGFNCVRVPLHHALCDEAHLARVDRLVAECRRLNMWVLLDLHAAPGGQTGENIDDGWGYPWLFESEESQVECVDLWVRLARRYRDEPTVLGYELLNEPIPNFPEYALLEPRLEPFYRRATAAIREVDRRHLVVLDGAEWAADFSVFGPPFDEGLVYGFHRYWSDPSPAGIQPYVEFRARHGVPVLMTESGENKDEWIATFRGTLEGARVGWCFWPYKKLLSASCVVSVQPPPGWDAVKTYADACGLTSKEKRALRPAGARETLDQLLDNVELSRCRLNPGYVQALLRD